MSSITFSGTIDSHKKGFSAEKSKQYYDSRKKIFFSKSDLVLENEKIKINRKIVKKIFSSFSSHVVAIQEIKKASLHRVFLVTTKDAQYILRISLITLFPDYSFAIASEIQRILRSYGFPSFAFFLIDLSRDIIPFDYEIIQKVEGHTLFEITQESKRIKNHVYQFGEMIAKIHSIKMKKFGPLHVDKTNQQLTGFFVSWVKFIMLHLDDHLLICESKYVIDAMTAKKIKAVFKKNKNQFKIISPSLLHGDVAHHNVFFHKNKIAACIDWEDALSGDPLYDIAYYATGAYGNQDWLDWFLQGYGTSKLLIEENSLYWLYYLRISLAKSVSRLRFISPPFLGERIIYGLKHLK